MKKIAIFASGAGTNAERIIDYFASSDRVKVALLLSNNPTAGALERARSRGVPCRVFTREELHDGRIAGLLLRERIDLVVLAGFLWLIPPSMTGAFAGRIVNIHPSLLPAYGGKGMYGARVHRAVVEAGERESGITVHLVDDRYDSGAVIARYRVALSPDETPESLERKIHRLEYLHYPPIIERLATGVPSVSDNPTLLPDMKLLLISNSTNAGEPYLQYPMPEIARTLEGVGEVVFVPYAAVTFSYDEYEAKVRARFEQIGVRVRSVHRCPNPAQAVCEAEAICVGGGNTFALVKHMQEQGLMEAIREKVLSGTPYVGWSAGSNVACPTLCTTNDMPIVEPESFRTIGLVGFQINPHYLDANPEGHAGETREQRILEFIEANPDRYVVGLREGCMLRVEEGRMELIGKRPMRLFRKDEPIREFSAGDDLSFLM